MKTLLTLLIFAFCISCNNSNKTAAKGDTTSVDIMDPNAVKNDVPMRTTDTTTNIMMDTMHK